MILQDSKTLLEVRGLCASVNGTLILKGLDFTVKSGEVHAIMGPNGPLVVSCGTQHSK